MSATPQELSDVFSEIEARIDGFYNSEYEATSLSIVDLLQEKEVGANQALEIYDHYTPLLKEVSLARFSEKETDREGYERMTKDQLDNYLHVIINMCNECVTWSKERRKPRKKKLKTPAQLVKLVNYQAEYKPFVLDLMKQGVVFRSVNPEEILVATGLLLYDTKYHRASLLVAQKGQTLGIHRTTVTNIDETQSIVKALDEKKLREVMTGNVMYATQFLTNHRRKRKPVSGRIGPNTLILKTFK